MQNWQIKLVETSIKNNNKMYYSVLPFDVLPLSYLRQHRVAWYNDQVAAQYRGRHHQRQGGEGVAEVEEARGEDLEHTAHNQNPSSSERIR